MKTLKWIYQLGYKHAENKLYHMLVNEINKKQQDYFDYLVAQEKQNQAELDRLQAIRYELQRIVGDVFKPEITESVEYFEKNRFEL